MVSPVELSEGLRGDGPGLVTLLQEPDAPLVLDAEEVGLGEGGIHRDVGQELEQPLQVSGEAVPGHVRGVHARAGVQARPQEAQLVGELEGRPGLRPLGDHRGGEPGHARQRHRVTGRASLEQHEVDGDDGQPVELDEADGEPVRELELLLRRELQFRRRAERRDLSGRDGRCDGRRCGDRRRLGAPLHRGAGGEGEERQERYGLAGAHQRASFAGAGALGNGVGMRCATVSATRRVLASQVAAAARMSAGVTAR